MSQIPSISIVVPNFNGGATLDATLRSLVEQEYPRIEILVADGGSTDNSVEVIRRYEKQIAWWISEKDRGQSHAINKGFARATGDVVNWLCSDDQLSPGALRHVGAIFAEDPGIDVVAGACRCVFEHQGGSSIVWTPDPGKLKLMPCCCPIPQSSCFYRRALLSRPGPLDEGLHYTMDFELWCYFQSRNARWHVTPTELSIYLNSGQNKTCSGTDRMFEEHLQVYDRYVQERVPLSFWQRRVRRRFQQVRPRVGERRWKYWRFLVRPPERAIDFLLGLAYGRERVKALNWEPLFAAAIPSPAQTAAGSGRAPE